MLKPDPDRDLPDPGYERPDPEPETCPDCGRPDDPLRYCECTVEPDDSEGAT